MNERTGWFKRGEALEEKAPYADRYALRAWLRDTRRPVGSDPASRSARAVWDRGGRVWHRLYGETGATLFDGLESDEERERAA